MGLARLTAASSSWPFSSPTFMRIDWSYAKLSIASMAASISPAGAVATTCSAVASSRPSPI
ncbi:Uncharacterised protein [Mycobacteroides abscessus subsp. abscessus]|nr:Uncharacterised protein [Mycobacteroides abscessus subsp. abscessus]